MRPLCCVGASLKDDSMSLKNEKQTPDQLSDWLIKKIKKIFYNNPWRWIPRDEDSKWYHTLLYRLHNLLFSRPVGFGWELIHFYRSYEPNWLAKITDPSYAFQLKVDEVIDNYLKENNVRLERGTWCDPGQNVDYCLIIKKDDWTEDQKYNFKHGLEKAIYRIYGYAEYPSAWKSNSPKLWMNTKYGGSCWQWHFVTNIIEKTLYGHYDKFMTEKTFKNVYEENYYDK